MPVKKGHPTVKTLTNDNFINLQYAKNYHRMNKNKLPN